MPFSLLKRLLGLGASSAAKQTYPHPAEELLPPHLIKDLREGTWRQLKYPPFQEGFPARKRGRDLMFLLQPELVTRIRASLGFSDEMFEQYVEPILVNFADLVHLLPASENDHHNGPGGLIKHCLEVANFALDGCLTAAFDSSETPSRKSARSLRWRLAGMAAGLLHDAGKALTDMRVMDFKGEIRWSYTEGSIYEWSEREDITRYFIYWNADRHENHKPESAALTTKIIPPHVEAWLSEFGRDIYTDLLKAVQGIPSKSRLTELVSKADSSSVELDKRKGPSGGETGVPVTRMVTDCMLRLKEVGVWEANKLGGRIWVAQNGVFISWNTGAQEVVEKLVSEGITAIPRSPDTLIGILADNNIAERTEDGDLYWLVAPHILRKNGKGPALKCLKLASSRILYPHGDLPDPISISLGREGSQVEFLAAGDAGAAADQQPADQAGEAKPAKPKQKKSAAPAPAPAVSDIPSVPSIAPEPTKEPVSEPEPEPEECEVPQINVNEASIEDLLMVLSPGSIAHHEESQAMPAEPEQDAPVIDAPAEHDQEPASSISAAKPTTGKVSLSALFGTDTPAKPAEPREKRQLSLSEIMGGNPEPVDKPTSAEIPAAAPAVAQATAVTAPVEQIQPEPTSLNTITEAADEQGLELDMQIRNRLTQVEITRLESHPRLSRKLLACCDNKQNLRIVYSKIFVPFFEHSDFTREDIPALVEADWIWQDFAVEDDEGLVRIVNKRAGFVLCDDLSLIISKITEDFAPVEHYQRVPESELETWSTFVEEALSLCQRERLGQVEVFTLPFHQFDEAATRCGIEPADAERALYALRDTVRVVRRRRFYIRARREEYIKK